MGDVIGWLFALGLLYLVFLYPAILAYTIVIAFTIWILCLFPWMFFVLAFAWALGYLAKD